LSSSLLSHSRAPISRRDDTSRRADDTRADAAGGGESAASAAGDDSIPSNTDIDDADRHIIVLPGLRFGPKDGYRIKEEIGEGTFGKVLLAEDCVNQHKVAVKVVRALEKYRDAARAEIKVLQTIAKFDAGNKSGCVRLLDSFEWRGHVCMVFHAHGKSLYDFIKDNQYKPFRINEVAVIGVALLQSVVFLHDLTLVHTDLKPENILLDNDKFKEEESEVSDLYRSDSSKYGRRKVPLSFKVKLIDFGSATFNERHHTTTVSTRHYRAPEVLLRAGWSYPCDLWSVGTILIELFTGDALFQTHDEDEHLHMIERALKQPFPVDMVRDAEKIDKTHIAEFFNSQYELRAPVSVKGRTASEKMRAVRDMVTPDMIFERAARQMSNSAKKDAARDFHDLLKHLIHYDPRTRWRARDAINHRFFDSARKQRPDLDQFTQRRSYAEVVGVMEKGEPIVGVGSDAFMSERTRKEKDREDRPREDRPREDRPREDRSREDRSRDDRSRDDRSRDDRSRDDRSRDDRSRDDRSRDDRSRDDRSRDDRSRDDRSREDRSRDDRSRDDRSRDERSRREAETSSSESRRARDDDRSKKEPEKRTATDAESETGTAKRRRADGDGAGAHDDAILNDEPQAVSDLIEFD
jgi:dual-specificity kinase